jgi:magnesium transporter
VHDTTGLHPSSPPPAEAIIDCAVYNDGARLPGGYSPQAAYDKVREQGSGFVWVGLHEPDHRQMQAVADVFGLHPLAVEDAVQAYQRPKLERYDTTLLLVLKTVNYIPHKSISLDREIVETGEIMVFTASDFVITVRHGEFSGLARLRAQLEADAGRLALGPFAVMHAAAERVVNHYRDVAVKIESDIDTMNILAADPTHAISVEQIYLLKREMVELRRAISPLSAELAQITSAHHDLIPPRLTSYLREIIEQQHDVAEQINNFDEMLTTLVETAQGHIGVQQNSDMRKIAAWAALGAVVTLISGIYGMRFVVMPELRWTWGYPAVLALIAGICGLLYRAFRHNHWL